MGDKKLSRFIIGAIILCWHAISSAMRIVKNDTFMIKNAPFHCKIRRRKRLRFSVVAISTYDTPIRVPAKQRTLNSVESSIKRSK